jgi:rhodanese-related sulfurtransferase
MSASPAPRFRLLLVLSALLVALLLAGCGGSSPTTAPAAPAASSGTGAGTAASAPAALAPEVDVAAAAALQGDGAFMLDVREPDEWAAGHIDGATLIPLGELEARVAEVPTDRKVVVVCRSGNRSATGRDILLGAGHPSATSMAGGMKAWAAAGNEVVTGQ